MTKIKICGITNLQDAQYSAKLGADFLGFVFYKESSRFISPDKAEKIICEVSYPVMKVGVFVNEDIRAVKQIARDCRLDILQFHGDEAPAYLEEFKGCRTIKAFRIKGDSLPLDIELYHSEFFLFDTFKEGAFGGTGEAFDWDLLKSLKELNRPFIVSGGLTVQNVPRLIKEIAPFAVDVSSGVEASLGKKDYALVNDFIQAVRS